MAKIQRNFIKGRMNKSVDERLVPNGEYVHAENVRLGSTEESEIGSVENAAGNERITDLKYEGDKLSGSAKCIGAVEDGINETIYWFIHDSGFTSSPTGKLDMIVSYNIEEGTLTYNLISVNDGDGVNTTLNFNPNYLINGVNVIDDQLFFTDNINPPRRINIKRNYPNPIGTPRVDQFTAEEIMVIKKPPINSPRISPETTPSDNNFLEERLISFAYRYRYADNQYSATSQFSAPAFIPKGFSFDYSNYVNAGMQNLANACEITYNSGGPLVVGIDLLFKEMGDSTIKVIEKLDKSELGLADDTEYTYFFDNSKIYTILDDAEILRLYDNVPHTAQAQTIMGNRLMYGNYKDGYDVVDVNGEKVKLEYSTSLISEDVADLDIPTTLSTGNYTYGSTVSINSSVVNIDLSGVDLKAGSVLSFYIALTHNSFAGDTPFPTEETALTEIRLDYILQRDYESAYELATNSDFQKDIGVVEERTSGTTSSVSASKLVDSTKNFISLGVQEGDLVTNTSTNTSTVVNSVAATELTLQDDIFTTTGDSYSVYSSISIKSVEDSCTGITLTDLFNCAIPQNLDTLTKTESGITGGYEPIRVIPSSTSSVISLQLPAMRFVDNVTTPTQSVYEYYEITSAEILYREIANPTSLHSNRDYQVGIIYMDEFNRATTALVSTDNTVHVPCSASDLRNQIQVTIPPQQSPPSWATRYKFAIKPDKEGYDTIYSSIYYKDPTDNSVYFLLEGENARKVEVGDRYQVKADSSGVIEDCVKATVLEKESKPSDFIVPPPTDDDGNELTVLSGVYMKMKPKNFDAILDADAIIALGQFSKTTDRSGSHPRVEYPANLETGTDQYTDYKIPINSRVKLFFEFRRKGNNFWNCDEVYYKSEVEITASTEYENLKDFFDNQNVADILNNSAIKAGNACNNSEDIQIVYIDELLEEANGDNISDVPQSLCNMYMQFFRSTPNTSNGKLDLIVVGTRACGGGDKQKSRATVEIEVIRAEKLIVFETEPQDSVPDTWFEGSESYEISGGYHVGNVQTQTDTQPALITTEFFNCISFGNGVESYKILDSITGRTIELGNRVTTVANQDFKRADRYSDITYSGIYNDESNINNLNSFNLGQLNFKALEDTFGPIQVLSGRMSDILVLQEDKISYVLTGKNLLSDSIGGGAISSVPEVLGTQIARVEDYGISHNPESYTEWGAKKYFTDAKRGSVIELIGSSAQNEQLNVVSEFGMRSWFRDMFIDSFNTQKLGAYDPYMDEYVLASTNTRIPEETECIGCGITKKYDTLAEFCVDMGQLVGASTITYDIEDPTDVVEITANYNGVLTSSGNVSGSGSFTFDKDSVSNTTAHVRITSTTGQAEVNITVGCPQAQTITIFEIAITSALNEGEFITNQYRWTDGTFVSPLHSERMEFASGTDIPIVSLYNDITGPQGAGIVPANGAEVKMISKRIAPVDNYQFDASVDKFFFLRSNTLYENNSTDINSLLAAATEVAVSGVDANTFEGTFTMPDTSDQYLYIIYDYRNGVAQELCFGTDRYDVCCDCPS